MRTLLRFVTPRQFNRWEQSRGRAIIGKGQPARRAPSPIHTLQAPTSLIPEAASGLGLDTASTSGASMNHSGGSSPASSLQLRQVAERRLNRDVQWGGENAPNTDWVRAIQHYEVAVLCGAPLRPEHAFRIAALFAQDNGTMEQFLRWWWLFRCEALPPSTAEVVALQKHQLWDQCLLTVATSDPWNPLLAREAASLFIRQSLWELSLRVLLGAPSAGKPAGWVNEGELLPQEEPLEVPRLAEGGGEKEEVEESLSSSSVPKTTPTDSPTKQQRATPRNAAHGSYYQRHIPAVADAVADAPFAVAKTVRLLCRIAEQERMEKETQLRRRIGAQPQANAQRSSQDTGRDEDTGALNRFALAAALRMHSLEVLRGPDTERAVGIAARSAVSQLSHSSRPVSLTPSHPSSSVPPPVLAPFASELKRSASGAELPDTWTAKSVPSSLPPNVADPVVVTPTIGNILFRLAVQSEDMTSAKRFASAVVQQFGPQTLSAVTLRQYLRRLVFGSKSGERSALASHELDQLVESETLLTHCAERLQNSDRHWISALFEQHGRWSAALSVGGVEYVLEAADRVSSSIPTTHAASSSLPAGAERDSAIKMIQAALQQQYLSDGNGRASGGSLSTSAGAEDEASRLIAIVSERVQLQQRLSIAALDSLAALQLQSGRWVDAIGTIRLLVAGAARLDEWRSQVTAAGTEQKESAPSSSSHPSTQRSFPIECDSHSFRENPPPIRGSNPDGSLTLLEAALLDATRSVETWRDALDLFK
jgi:hypothetical protein